MLFQVPNLTERDRQVIDAITKSRKDLAHVLSTPRRWTGVLRRSTLGRVIRGSNSIEGFVIPRDDVVAAAEGAEVDANLATQQATETYRRAMTHVLGLAQDPDFEWSVGLIKSLHYMMLEYDLDKKPGRWRTGTIFVVDEERGIQVYEGPDVDLVPSLMGEFVESLRVADGTPEIVRAAMAHLNLAMIHPFKDGNGRMARCIQTLVLGRAGTLEPMFSSIEEYLSANTRPYYDVLADVGKGSWHPENDALGWVRFCLRAHHFQAQTLLKRTRESEVLMGRLDALVKEKGLTERAVFALWDAAQGFRVRNSTYRAVADIGEQTASRDLKAMVEAGLLLPHGENKSRSYLASPAVARLQIEVSEGRTIKDPYEELAPPTMATTTGTTTSMVIDANFSSSGPRPPSWRLQSAGQGPERKP